VVIGTFQHTGIGVASDQESAKDNLRRAIALGSETAGINYLSFAKHCVDLLLQRAVGGPLITCDGSQILSTLSPEFIAWVKRAVLTSDYCSMALVVCAE
jgi:hypothetical protein